MKKLCVTCMIGCLMLFSGCSARQMVTNEVAGKIVGVLDAQYEKNLKAEPAKNAGAAQYCVSVSVPVSAAVKSTEYMLEGYRTSVTGDASGEEIAAKIVTLQGNLKGCVYVRCKNASGVDVSALRSLANALGVNAGVEPPGDSCKKYETLSAEIRKLVTN